MIEPTIDEMLAYLDHRIFVDRNPMDEAIRTIVEKHGKHIQWVESVIIGAFVERVDAKFSQDRLACPDDYRAFVDDELRAMEKEAE